MPPPIPRCSNWAYSSLNSPSCFSLPRYGSRVGLHIFLFEACSTFTRVAACTLALSPIRDTLIEGFSHFVTSMTAPIASGWSGCRVGLTPTGKRRLCTAHAKIGSRGSTLIVRRLVHFLVSDPAAAPNALPQTVAPIALAKDLFRSRLEAWFPPKMMVGSLGSSAAGLTFNLEPLFTSAAHTSELFEEPVRIDQRVGFARLASRQPVVSFR